MSWWVNLLTQVRNKLPVSSGGTGHDQGTTWVLKSCQNMTGSSLALGTLVEMLNSYDDTRVRPVVAADATNVVGVVVGYFADSDGTTLVRAAAPNGGYAAVCVVGSVDVRIGQAVTRGQYAYSHATSGTAKSTAALGVGAFGVFESSASSGLARVRIPGSTAAYGAPSFGDIVSKPTADQSITAQSATVTPLYLVGAASQSDNMFEVRDSGGAVLAFIFIGTTADQIEVRHLSGSAPAAQLRAGAFGAAQSGSHGVIVTKSRGTSIGTHGIVSDGDTIGMVDYRGSDGSTYVGAARVLAQVDGTPGSSDMPGRLLLSTTPDGSSASIERVRIDSRGVARFLYGLELTGVISPSQITSNQNDYNPTDGATTLWWRLTSDASRTITGIVAGNQGVIHYLENIGGTEIILAHQHSGSSSSNRFVAPSGLDYVLKGGDTVLIRYDTTTARWRVSGVSPGGGSGGGRADLGWYGDSHDGSLVLDGTVTPNTNLMTKSGSTYTLVRDAYFSSLTIDAGVTLRTNGQKAFVAGTLTNNGTIERQGNPGSSNNPGAGFGTGTTGGSVGGGGGATTDANGSNGGAVDTNGSAGGPGGNGGISGTGRNGGSGGSARDDNGGTVSAPNQGGLSSTSTNRGRPLTAVGFALGFWSVGGAASQFWAGGAGGGGGGRGTSATSGGGGGGGGGVLVICARKVKNTGTVQANGGTGANGTGTNAGGGGGGGGGVVAILTDSYDNTGTVQAAGGAAGTGAGGGGDGAVGGAGNVYVLLNT